MKLLNRKIPRFLECPFYSACGGDFLQYNSKFCPVQYPPHSDNINSTEAQPNTDHPDIEGGRKGGQKNAG